MSGIHVVRKGYVTKVAQPSVARQRGPVAYACSLLVSGAGSDGATNPLNITDLTGGRTFTRALTPMPTNVSPYASGGGSIYQTGTARQCYYANPLSITTGEFCIEGWFNPENFSAGRKLLSNKAWQFGNNKGFELNITTAAKVQLLASQGVWNNFAQIIISTASLTANAWNHVAITRDSNNVMRLFINGVADASVTYAGSLDQVGGSGFGAHYFSIGNDYGDGQFGAGPFNGYIGDVRIGTGTGSAIYTTNFTPPTATLTATTGTILAVKSDAFVRESSGNNVPVTPIGSVGQVGPSPFGGSYPGSLSFSSNASYLSARTNPGFSFPGQFTVEAWFYWTATPSAGQITGVLAAGGFNITYNTTLQFNLFGTGAIASAAFTPVIGRWYHIAMTRDASNLCTVWIDGVASATGTSSASFAQGSWSLYGGSNNGGAGNVTNLRVVKDTALYTSNFTPSTTPLTAVAGTSLLLLGNNVGIGDSSASANAVSLFGTSKISTDQAKYGSSSLYFDGSTGYLSVANASNIQFTGSMFQVEFWMYPMANGRFITGKGNTGGTSGWSLYISSAGNFLNLQVGGNLFATSHAVVLNTWQHVAFSRDINNVMRVFVDGVLKYSTTDGTSFSQSDSLIIGSARNVTSKFQGYIADYRIFSGGLKYIADFTPPALSLSTNDACFTGFTNANYGVNNSFGSGAAQGLVTRSAAPSLARQRGPIDYACSLLINGNGTDGAQNPLMPVDLAGTRSFQRALSPFQVNTTPYWPDGQWSNYFNGSTQYLTVASNAAFAMGTSDFTLECWYNPQPKTALYPLIAGNHTTAWAANAWELCERHASASTKFLFQAYNYSSSTPLLVSTTTVVIGVWYHIAVTRSGDVWRLFIDGVLEATTTASFSADGGSTHPFQIGRGDAASSALIGSVSNLRLVKGTALYTANFTPSTTPLTAVSGTSLLTCQSNRFKDNSSNNFAITVTGSPSVQPIAPFAGPSNSDSYGGSIYNEQYSNSAARLGFYTDAVPITTGEFCIEYWCRPNSVTTGYNVVWNRAWNTGYNRGWTVDHTNAGKVQLTASTGSWNSFQGVITSTTSLTANAWNHVAVVRDSSNVIKIFINGVQDATTVTYAASLDLTSGGGYGAWLFILGNGYGDGQFGTSPFQGYLGDVRIGNGAGAAIYTANFTPPTAALTPTTSTILSVKLNPLFRESGGYNRAIIPLGGVNQVAASPFGSTYPGSLSFNGSTGYLQTLTDAGLNFNSSDYTAEAWVYLDMATYSSYDSGGRGIVSDFLTGSNGRWLLSVDASGKLGFYEQNASGTNGVSAVDPASMPLRQWVHVAAVKSGTTMYLFRDGVLVATNTSAVRTTFGGRINIGQLTVDSNYRSLFLGRIANLRLVKGTALYTSNFTPSTVPLTAITGTALLLLGNNLGVSDSSSNGYTISTFGNARLSNAQSKFGGTSVYFDGTGDYLTVADASPLQLSVQMLQIECWVYRSVTGVVHTIASKGASTTGWQLQISAADKLTFTVGTSVVMTSTASIPANTWTHVSVTRDGANQMRLFVNGAQEATVNNSSTFTQTEVLRIGADRSATNFFNGYMEDFRIFRDGVKYIAGFSSPTDELSGTDSCYRFFTNTTYGTYKTI